MRRSVFVLILARALLSASADGRAESLAFRRGRINSQLPRRVARESGVHERSSSRPARRWQASFRFHRIERHYEYSYRILAVADARMRVK